MAADCFPCTDFLRREAFLRFQAPPALEFEDIGSSCFPEHSQNPRGYSRLSLPARLRAQP